MLKSNRKKTLLENHNKLTPIDERQLKGIDKLKDNIEDASIVKS